MKRRRRPSHSPVNWTVVVVAALLTLGIGIVVASLSAGGGQQGGIVVPTPSSPPQVFLTPRPS